MNDTIVAEWEAWFYSKEKQKEKHIQEVAILELEDGKIKTLTEYWGNEKKSLAAKGKEAIYS